MCERQFVADGFQIRLQVRQLPVKNDGLVGLRHPQPALVSPAHKPLQ